MPHGKHSDVIIKVPAGATVSWRWGAQAHDASFSVTSVPASSSSSSSDAVINVTKSIAGVHQLAKGYTGPAPHGLRQPHTPPVVSSKGSLSDPIPGAAAGVCGLDELENSPCAMRQGAHTAAITFPSHNPYCICPFPSLSFCRRLRH